MFEQSPKPFCCFLSFTQAVRLPFPKEFLLPEGSMHPGLTFLIYLASQLPKIGITTCVERIITDCITVDSPPWRLHFVRYLLQLLD